MTFLSEDIALEKNIEKENTKEILNAFDSLIYEEKKSALVHSVVQHSLVVKTTK